MITSSAYYEKLNNRFDGRAKQLWAIGFKQTHIPEFDMACFFRKRLSKTIPTTVPNSFIMHADDLCWEDRMEELNNNSLLY